METPAIILIQHLVSALRSGKSSSQAIMSFKAESPQYWSKLHLSKTNQKEIPVSSIEYELKFILERGAKGFPVLNSLNELHKRALEKLHNQIDLHTARTPFLALIPLFLLQMPSLIVIFIYPLLSELLESFT